VEEIIAWCETPPEVYDCGGLAKKSRLLGKLTPAQVTGPDAVLPLRRAERAGVCRVLVSDADELAAAAAGGG
jgi:hypothetical protein